jgi:hypothetical protein
MHSSLQRVEVLLERRVDLASALEQTQAVERIATHDFNRGYGHEVLLGPGRIEHDVGNNAIFLPSTS